MLGRGGEKKVFMLGDIFFRSDDKARHGRG
jgi:hypothetical protein